MTLKDFKKQAKATKINNTNAWGFSGYVGTTYELGKFKHLDATWYGRHTNSKCTEYRVENRVVTKNEFIKELENDTNN